MIIPLFTPLKRSAKAAVQAAIGRLGYRLIPANFDFSRPQALIVRGDSVGRLKERGEGARQFGLVATAASASSLFEPRFDRALRLGIGQDPIAEIENMRARIYNFVSYLDIARNVEGAVLQIGVSYGKFVRVALEFFGEELAKPIFLIDPWELAKPSDDPAGMPYCHSSAEMLSLLGDANAARVTPIIGYAPEALTQVPPPRFAFVHMNVALPDVELASFEAVYDRVSPGGVVLIDYFAWQGSGGAEDRYQKAAAERGARFVSLLNGQGVLIKPAY